MNTIEKIKKNIDDNNLAFYILLDQLSKVYENKLKYPNVQKYDVEYNETLKYINDNHAKMDTIRTTLLEKNKAIADNVKTADIKINEYKKTNSLMENQINKSTDKILTSQKLYDNHVQIYNKNLWSTYIFSALSVGIIGLFVKEIYQINNNNL